MNEFYQQIPFIKGLSMQSILKIEKAFFKNVSQKAGHIILREGDPVTHIALVMKGEFEVVKKSVKGLDDRIMEFLRKTEVRKNIASHVLLLPGRSTVF